MPASFARQLPLKMQLQLQLPRVCRASVTEVCLCVCAGARARQPPAMQLQHCARLLRVCCLPACRSPAAGRCICCSGQLWCNRDAARQLSSSGRRKDTPNRENERWISNRTIATAAASYYRQQQQHQRRTGQPTTSRRIITQAKIAAISR